ncbi:signal recognition particle-docking protein FtsY [Roseivivax sp. GX 12232]|uniref:signal recognition particle-docking protein FtsY n=1 Tax=Roseivivax sp. GX 12232 TaxID=2900547 RepID=UPI001E5E88C8|nr:signal recognition particle-docking protein FtsY [Roseivivax sp. GX 12232]MCE0505150.1 signal recognition particle-docking protein FtsY [Roseivivax sp. GX 12232]
MSFFGKLKSRLFKSSSKLEEGLDAIVAEGGSAEPEAPEAETRREGEGQAGQAGPETGAAEAPAETPPAPESAEEAPRPSEDTPPSEPAPRDGGPAEQTEAPAPEPETPETRPEAPAPEAAPRPEAPENKAPEPRPTSEEAPQAPESDPAPTPRPDAKEPAKTAPAPRAESQTPAPEARPASTKPADTAPPKSDAPAPAAHNDAALQSDTPRSDPAPAGPAPIGVEAAAPAPEPEAPKGGMLSRLFGRRDTPGETRRALDDDMLESLEELLIAADMGVETALRVTANMAEGRMGKRLSSREIKELLATEIARIMEPVAKPLPLYPSKPQVVLVVGVNGSGKTTTIGKLASQFRAAGKSVVIAAGDTFRAAAVEQLQVWGDRAGVPVLTAPEGSDPASLAFDAMGKAQSEGADLLMIDTAGRLQNRADLMAELEKIVRVIRKKDPDAPHNTLLVLDATTGQNALNQVETFQKLADVSGLVMTKLDGTAKGGVLVALADRFGLPIHAIGVGEQIDDLAPFDPEEFAAALTGVGA